MPLFPVSRPRPGPRAEILLRGAGLAQGLQAPELGRLSSGGYGPSLSLCAHCPPPVPLAPWARGPPQRPTLGLKAMSFRIISTVKRPVNSMLRMFMAILNRQLCP